MERSIRVESYESFKGFEAYTASRYLYRFLERGLADKFEEYSKAYQTVMNGIDPENGTGSQFFFNNELESYLLKGQRVARFDDLSRIREADCDGTFFGFEIYSSVHTSEIVLRNEFPSWNHEGGPILKDLVAQVNERGLKFSPENPLVLSGFNLVEDENEDNSYGILLKMTDSTRVVNDPRFSSRNNRIKFGRELVELSTAANGLSNIFHKGRIGFIESSLDCLDCSDSTSEVMIFSDINF